MAVHTVIPSTSEVEPFESNLVYRTSLGTARATQRNPCLQHKVKGMEEKPGMVRSMSIILG